MNVAVQAGHLEVVRLLLAAKADKDRASCSGLPPLHVASQAGQLKIVQLLLQANADKHKEGTGASPR